MRCNKKFFAGKQGHDVLENVQMSWLQTIRMTAKEGFPAPSNIKEEDLGSLSQVCGFKY